jgi:O-antigen/teichoic acid export membrane protein
MTIAAPHLNKTGSRSLLSRRLLTRFATVADQLLVALANFGLTISIGRAFGVEEIAAYGVGLSAGLMIQALQRHAIIIPLMLQPPARVARRRGGIFAQHCLVLGCLALCALGVLALSWLAGISRFGYLIVGASAVCLLVYAELEFARAILVKLDRTSFLFGSAAWYALISAALAWASLHQRVSFDGLLVALAAAMLIHAAALFALASRFSPREGIRLLIADIRRYGGWAVVATLTYSGYNHLPLFVLGAMASPIHAAAFVATRSLMQPLQILLRGLDIADKAMFAERAGAPQSQSALRLTVKLASLYAMAASVFGTIACLFADNLIYLAYGGKFSGFGPALIAWVPAYALLSVSLPFESLVYARQAFRSYYLVRGIGSVIAVVLTVPLMPWAEVGAIVACSIGSLIAIAGTVFILLREPGK